MLSEPALALTDLVLGAVSLTLAYHLRRAAGRDRLHNAWVATFRWMGAAAIAGFVHHGFVTYSDTLDGPSFGIVTTMVVVAVSFLLAATVYEVLGPDRRPVFLALRVVTLAGYVALAVAGRAGTSSILLAESVTMVLILGLWFLALWRGHERAPRVITAFVVSALAAVVQALPADSRLLGLDPVSLYHLAQIPGIVLLYGALTAGHRSEASSLEPTRPSGRAAHL